MTAKDVGFKYQEALDKWRKSQKAEINNQYNNLMDKIEEHIKEVSHMGPETSHGSENCVEFSIHISYMVGFLEYLHRQGFKVQSYDAVSDVNRLVISW